MNTFDEILDLIEELTTSGNAQLEENHMKRLKKLCRDSSERLEFAYNSLMDQLAKNHAEIRYSTFQIINELFARSHLFRKLIVNNLQCILLLAAETDPKKSPMPLPSKVGKRLKVLTLKAVNEWHKRFGSNYRRLALGFEFLKEVKNVNFFSIDAMAVEEKRKEKERQEKEAKVAKSKVEQVDIQIYDSYNDIMASIKQMENCFQLLIPNVVNNDLECSDYTNGATKEVGALYDSEDFEDENLFSDIGFTAKEDEIILNDNFHNNLENAGTDTGIQGRNYSVIVEISNKQKIVENENNTEIVKMMCELQGELEDQFLMVKRWLRIISKYANSDTERLNKVLELKNTLTSLNSKYFEMNIERLPEYRESEDDDFVDVPEKLPSSNYNKKDPERKGDEIILKAEEPANSVDEKGVVIGEDTSYEVQNGNQVKEVERKHRLNYMKFYGDKRCRKRKLNTVKEETAEEISKRRYARLSNIKKNAHLIESRLEKKIFNKRSVKRVQGNLDAVMKKKHAKKFGSNLN